MNYYKIVDVIDGNVKTLFHGVEGSRTVPRKTWVKAERKLVRDGTSKTWYESGWHVTPTKQECVDYLIKFKNVEHKQILKCKVRGEVRPKEHSPSNVFLADEIYFY